LRQRLVLDFVSSKNIQLFGLARTQRHRSAVDFRVEPGL
jgi:hypothetical protein